MSKGERVKIDTRVPDVSWGVNFGKIGNSMALAADEKYLVVGAF